MNYLTAMTTILAGTLSAGAAWGEERQGNALQVSWTDRMLTIRSDRVPGGKVEVWYLEAFCRRGSTDREWSETVVPSDMALAEADPEGRWVRIKSLTAGVVEGLHEIRAGTDEVDFRIELTNQSDRAVDVEWAQPCMRVDRFTGRGQDDYFRNCFLFTDRGMVRMHETHRATTARYTPGQVYVPAGVDRSDVNPRPISNTRPINGLVGCFSADDKMILAMAWDSTQELFQGIIVCIHSDFRIGGLKPHETKRLHGKIYVVESDVDNLLKRYERDFPAKR